MRRNSFLSDIPEKPSKSRAAISIKSVLYIEGVHAEGTQEMKVEQKNLTVTGAHRLVFPLSDFARALQFEGCAPPFIPSHAELKYRRREANARRREFLQEKATAMTTEPQRIGEMPSFEELMTQACKTVENYLSEAQGSIDRVFGAGYARHHPELVAAFIRTAAQDFDTAVRYRIHKEKLYGLRKEWTDEACCCVS